MYKLRTMYADAESRKAQLRPLSEQDGPAFKMKNDPRVTWVGKYLRKTCIDELPQLWNVLRGDMTLVGPRPLPCDEADACAEWQKRRLDVTPGLTCIWQATSGKERVPFAEWMRMDMRYIKERSLLKDLKLLAKTFWAVIRHRASH
jgi:lipopolysaccharide/colanic/teichoic acid biosynthesis glycosyltransferase